MTGIARHRWLRGESRTDRERAAAALRLAAPLVTGLSVVDVHRRLRGPYTLGGTVLRSVVPTALAEDQELVRRHDIELLSVAPELRAVVPATRETLTSLAVPEERTRFYSRLRTLRIAHGIAEFLRDHLAATGPRSLVVENVAEADPTDQELLAVLLRRIDPALLTVVVCSGRQLPEGPLPDALAAYPEPQDLETSTVDDTAGSAEAYVAGDCTDQRLAAAYHALPAERRAELHDRRAEELAAREEESLRLGAIPFHREHGSDPAGAGADALRHALDYCIDLGFYHSTVEFGIRGRALVDREAQLEHWWAFTTKMTTSLAALSRAAEAESLYNEARAISTRPSVHMQAAYATAMLYTRHHEESMRDDQLAKGWINEAAAFAGLEADPKERAFLSVFMRNGLALVEVHLRNLDRALELVTDGLDQLDRELEPDEHRLHRSVLRYNRGQVYAGLGRIEDALADYDAVIAADPNYAEYFLDRGNLRRRCGREQEALADYETAMRLSPPFPEVFYNRGDVRAEAGDLDGAMADFGYVLELDPTFVDAYVNRAGLRLELGDLDGARSDALSGLRHDRDNPFLHTVLGRVHAESGEHAEAVAEFDLALAADADHVAALSGRASSAHELGDAETADRDLRRAVGLSPDDAALRYNLAFVHSSGARWDEALADLDAALALAPDDEDIRTARAECLTHLAVA